MFDANVETLMAKFFVDNDVERALISDALLHDDDRTTLLTLYRTAVRRSSQGC